MPMMRKEGPGDYQIGIWSVRREGRKWRAVATGPGTLGDGSPQIFATLGAAYLDLTGEPLREPPQDPETAERARENLSEAELSGASGTRLAVLRARVRQAEHR